MTFGDIIVLFFFCLLCGVIVWEVLRVAFWIVVTVLFIILFPFTFFYKEDDVFTNN